MKRSKLQKLPVCALAVALLTCALTLEIVLT